MRDLFLADPLLLLLASAAVAGLIGLAAVALVFHVPAFRSVVDAPLRTTYLDAVSTIFALFLAFTTADAWQRNERARDALVREGQGLRQSLLIARAAGAEAVAAPLLAYLRAVTEQEWRRGKNRAPVAEAEAALAAAERAVASRLARPAALEGPPVAFWSEILSRLQRVREARAARLQIGGAFGDEARWGALLLLGLVSAVAIASTGRRQGGGRFCCSAAWWRSPPRSLRTTNSLTLATARSRRSRSRRCSPARPASTRARRPAGLGDVPSRVYTRASTARRGTSAR